MYLCLCYGVTEKKVAEAVNNGLTELKDLKAHLGLGSQCGQCIKATQAYLLWLSQQKDTRPIYKVA